MPHDWFLSIRGQASDGAALRVFSGPSTRCSPGATGKSKIFTRSGGTGNEAPPAGHRRRPTCPRRRPARVGARRPTTDREASARSPVARHSRRESNLPGWRSSSLTASERLSLLGRGALVLRNQGRRIQRKRGGAGGLPVRHGASRRGPRPGEGLLPGRLPSLRGATKASRKATPGGLP